MSHTNFDLESFDTLINRVRNNESDAIEEVFRYYEPLVRREIRVGLARSRKCRILDTDDVSQSVWYSFFSRMSSNRSQVIVYVFHRLENY